MSLFLGTVSARIRRISTFVCVIRVQVSETGDNDTYTLFLHYPRGLSPKFAIAQKLISVELLIAILDYSNFSTSGKGHELCSSCHLELHLQVDLCPVSRDL